MGAISRRWQKPKAGIAVGVGHHHRVEPPHAFGGERRQEHPAAEVAALPAAAVHEDGAAAVAQQDRVSLADVDERQLRDIVA